MSARTNNLYNAMPRFVWGMGVTPGGAADDREYLIHTQYPRFICRVDEDWEPLANLGGGKVMAAGQLRFSNFIWLDRSNEPVDDDALGAVLNMAAGNWALYNDD